MKKLPIYRVVKHTCYEKCDINREEYTIQVQRPFFFLWKMWHTIKELNCGWGDCHKTPIIFKTESEAIYAIKNLQKGYIADGWTGEITTVLDFNKKD